jgi:hypothetical protein
LARPIAEQDGRAFLIEFLGLPGAGKTHVAALVQRELSERGADARLGGGGVGLDVSATRRIVRKGWLAGTRGLSGPGATARFIARVGAGQRDRSSVVARSVQWFVTQALLERASRSRGIYLFEEGALQSLWSIGLRGDLGDVLRLLDQGSTPWVEPDLVVVVDAPTTVIRRRLRSRPSRHSRTQHLPDAAMSAELEHGAALLEDLVSWWRERRGSGSLLRVRNPEGGVPDVSVVIDGVRRAGGSRIA